MYYAVQGLTLLVLILAANTSFQGFPRLSALLARDRFAPRQFTNLGDRLVFSNGMVVLATVAGLLLWIYGANTNNLIHLYVIGVFTAFTLSQAGMVRYWFTRARHALAGEGARERRRCDRDGRRRRSSSSTRSSPRAPGSSPLRSRVLVLGDARRAAALRPARAPAARRCRGGRRRAAGAQHDAARRRADRRGGRSGAAHSPARSRATASAPSTCRRAEPTPASAPRWFKRAGEPLEALDPSLGVTEAVLEQVWRLPRSESDFVTVVVPELFASRSLARAGAAPARARAQVPAARRAGRRRRRRAGRRAADAEPSRRG